MYDRHRYDDCGEANIQSYAKYFVMKDALVAAYGSDTPIDYYSYVTTSAERLVVFLLLQLRVDPESC
jgi:hypothetical protein